MLHPIMQESLHGTAGLHWNPWNFIGFHWHPLASIGGRRRWEEKRRRRKEKKEKEDKKQYQRSRGTPKENHTKAPLERRGPPQSPVLPNWGSQNGVVTDLVVTSKSQETSPHGPSPHGLGTSNAPVARDILGERPESQNRAATPNPP